MKFLQQLIFPYAYTVEEIEKDKKYSVVKLMKDNGQEFDRDSFLVQVEREQNKFECVCSKYERDGILCCHDLRLLTQLGIHKIPDAYIKKRWTTSYFEDAIRKQKMITLDSEGNNSGQQPIEFAMMMTRCATVCASMSKDLKKSHKYMEEMEKVVAKIENESVLEEQLKSAGSTSMFKDPVVQVAASVQKGKRLL